MALTKQVRDIPIKRSYGELISNITSDPATTVASRNAINLRYGFDELLLQFTTLAGRVGQTPKINYVLFYDASAGTYRDLLTRGARTQDAMIDRGRSSVEQFTMDEDVDFLYVATSERVGGFSLTIDSSILNNDVSTMVYEYSSGAGFTVTAVTDGTKSTGIFEQDGIVEITTVPADGVWMPQILHQIQGIGHPDAAKIVTGGKKYYWSRISATTVTGPPLDAVEIEQLATLLVLVADTTGSASAAFHTVTTEYTLDLSQEIGGFEYWAQSGTTADLELSWFETITK